ncbi:hypothetical protein CALVIDRAFT_559562 [Calocera viscosa TUFC12733]|uniref:Uncharacterized protein n=1 Tax=Calocera viscosa (strain TUFC12733) TaxID=1330018 RepID=A0A167SBU2_CALVF|nr:hypothetical protein CALVIDRAFT_559562 [Calocera viscosa TUFC12733]
MDADDPDNVGGFALNAVDLYTDPVFEESDSIFCVAATYLPQPPDEYDFDHPFARAVTRGAVNHMMTSFRNVGVLRRPEPIVLMTDLDNIINPEEVRGNRPRANDIDSLTRVVVFHDERRVTCINGRVRVTAAWKMEEERVKAGEDVTVVWYAIVCLRNRLVGPRGDYQLFNRLANNDPGPQQKPKVGELWNIALSFDARIELPEDQRDELVRGTFRRFPAAYYMYCHDAFREAFVGLLRVPGWTTMSSFNRVFLFFRNQSCDFFIAQMGWTADMLNDENLYRFEDAEGNMVIYMEFKRQDMMSVYAKAFFHFAEAVERYLSLYPQHAPAQKPRYVSYVEKAMEEYFANGKTLNGRKLPRKHRRYKAQFIKHVVTYLSERPAMVVLTPTMLPALFRMCTQYDGVFVEMGRWWKPQYPVVGPGTKAQFMGHRSAPFPTLFAQGATALVRPDGGPTTLPERLETIVKQFSVVDNYVRLFRLKRSLDYVKAAHVLDYVPTIVQDLPGLAAFVRYRWSRDEPQPREVFAQRPPEPPVYASLRDVLKSAFNHQDPRGVNMDAGVSTRVVRWLDDVIKCVETAEVYVADLYRVEEWWNFRSAMWLSRGQNWRTGDRVPVPAEWQPQEAFPITDDYETPTGDEEREARLKHIIDLGFQPRDEDEADVNMEREHDPPDECLYEGEDEVERLTTFVLEEFLPEIDEEDQVEASVEMGKLIQRLAAIKVDRLWQAYVDDDDEESESGSEISDSSDGGGGGEGGLERLVRPAADRGKGKARAESPVRGNRSAITRAHAGVTGEFGEQQCWGQET